MKESRNKANPVHVHVPENTPLLVHIVNTENKSLVSQSLKGASLRQGSSPRQGLSPPRKEPWVPPPAKTTKRAKVLWQTKKTLQEEYYYENEAKINFPAEAHPEIDSSVNCLIASISNETVEHPEKTAKGIELEQSNLSFENDISYIEENVLSKEDLEILKQHCYSLQSSLLLLQRSLNNSFSEDSAINNTVLRTKQEIVESVNAVEHIQRIVSSFEMDGRGDSGWQNDSIIINKEKANVIAKLLDAYLNTGSVLQFVLDSQGQKGIAALCNEQGALKKSIEEMQRNFQLREAHIQDLENQLAASLDQVSSLQMMKMALEQTRTQMQRELISKESQLEHVKMQMQALPDSKDQQQKEIEKLIEIIEEIKYKSQAEKEALKKAVKVQKLRADQNEELCSQLKFKLQEKETMLYELAAERDRWKVKTTVATNKTIEAENRIMELEKQIQRLRQQKEENELTHKDEISKLNDSVDQKSTLLEEFCMQNEKLKAIHTNLEERCAKTESEFKQLQEKWEDVKDSLTVQDEKEQVKDTKQSEDIDGLTKLLQEVKEQLQAATEMNQQLLEENARNKDQKNNKDESDGNLSFLLQEMKEQLHIVKEVYRQFAEENTKSTQISSLTEKLLELEKKYSLALEEKQQLQARIEMAERRVPDGVLAKNTNSHSELQLHLVEKQKEANQLREELERNIKNNQNEIKELKDQQNRKELQSNIRISKLEEELQLKKNELSAVEEEKINAEEKLLKKINYLQESLDEATASNHSLQNYVQFLKSSYANVFGKP